MPNLSTFDSVEATAQYKDVANWRGCRPATVTMMLPSIACRGPNGDVIRTIRTVRRTTNDVLTYVRTYICTYVRTYARTYVRTYVRACVRTFVCTCIRSATKQPSNVGKTRFRRFPTLNFLTPEFSGTSEYLLPGLLATPASNFERAFTPQT